MRIHFMYEKSIKSILKNIKNVVKKRSIDFDRQEHISDFGYYAVTDIHISDFNCIFKWIK